MLEPTPVGACSRSLRSQVYSCFSFRGGSAPTLGIIRAAEIMSFWPLAVIAEPLAAVGQRAVAVTGCKVAVTFPEAAVTFREVAVTFRKVAVTFRKVADAFCRVAVARWLVAA